METFSKGKALQFGWETFKANAGFLIGVFIVGGIAVWAPDVISGWLFQGSGVLSLLLSLLGIVITLVVSIGITKIALKFLDGETPEFADLYQHYDLFLPVFLVSLLYGVIVGLGFVLLIIPGIILMLMLFMCDYLVIDQKIEPITALKTSAAMTRGHKGNLFLFTIILVLLNIAGFLALGIGLLVTMPVSVLASIHIYRELLSLNRTDSGEPAA
ncbi:DUF975 family protein [Spirochaeta dissipatitropha]